MSFSSRFKRVFQALANRSLDEATSFGINGELDVQGRLVADGSFCVFNRVVPNPDKLGRVLEIDAIVFTGGSLFCVEVKHFKGKVSFVPITKHKEGFWGWLGLNNEVVGYDKKRIVKEKDGNHGEGTFYTEFKNPLGSTKYFISSLKKYNRKFERLYFHPVVSFVDGDVDISNTHSMSDGIVYASELLHFFGTRSGRSLPIPHDEVLNELSMLPTWDKVKTRTGEEHFGILGECLTCRTLTGLEYKINWKEIASVRISREGGFSDCDCVYIRYQSGAIEQYAVADGCISLGRFGRIDRHLFRNISAVVVGTQAIR